MIVIKCLIAWLILSLIAGPIISHLFFSLGKECDEQMLEHIAEQKET